MKKSFKAPWAEVVAFEVEDIMCASLAGSGSNAGDEGGNDMEQDADEMFPEP